MEDTRYYLCDYCYRPFDQPKKVKDYSSLDCDIYVCPYCGSEDYHVEQPSIN